MGRWFWTDLFCLLISLQRAVRKQLSFSPGSASAAKTALFPQLPGPQQDRQFPEHHWSWNLLQRVGLALSSPRPIGGGIGRFSLSTESHQAGQA